MNEDQNDEPYFWPFHTDGLISVLLVFIELDAVKALFILFFKALLSFFGSVHLFFLL